MQIGYLGYQGYGNLGDEALYDAHRLLFTRFAVHGSRSPILRKFARFRESLFPPQYYFLGGGTLINQTDMILDYCRNLSKRGTKLISLGSGVVNPDFWDHVPAKFNPYGRNFDEWVPLLAEFAFLGVRGPLSLELLRARGLENAQLVGDPVVAFANDDLPPPVQEKIIGFNFGLANYQLIWGFSDEDFRNRLTGVLDHLLGVGYRVKILPVCDVDFRHCQKFLAAYHAKDPNANIELVAAWDNLADYRRELRKCRFFIGEKLHSVVLSTLERIPSIMMEYQPKCRDYMTSIDQGDFCIRTDEVSANQIGDMVQTFEAGYDQARNALDTNILGLRKNLRNAATRIEELVAS